MASIDYGKFFLALIGFFFSEFYKSAIRLKLQWFFLLKKRILMENQNSDNDNPLRIWMSVYNITGNTIKATFGIWDSPTMRCRSFHAVITRRW